MLKAIKTTTRAVVSHSQVPLFSSQSKMLGTLKFHSSNPTIDPDLKNYSFSRDRHCSLPRQPFDIKSPLRFRRLSVQSHYAETSEPSVSSHYTTSVESSSSSSLQLSQWNLTHRHILVLNVIACAVAVSATWLFFSAIPALLAFKRAAESLEKLMDVTREELPETMAAVRLSGMEISDLTMELSDLGQEITQGVRSSTRAVRLAEERLRGLTNVNPSVSMQELPTLRIDADGPLLARTARDIREGIVKGRAILQMFFTLTRFSRMALNYFAKHAKK